MLPILLGAPSSPAPYVPHAPIRIDGDAGFTPANGVTGGSGTASDPYVIEGWDIDTSAGIDGIWIHNTRAPFVIRSVSVHGGRGWSSSGLSLANVTDARVVNSTVTDTEWAITVWKAPGVAVLGNTLSSNSNGIDVGSSAGATIRGNVLNQTSDWAIDIAMSRDSKVVKNDIREGIPTYWQSIGIRVYSTSDVVVEANNVSQSYAGIDVQFADRVGVYQNSLRDNREGVSLYSSTNAMLTGNSFTADGVYMWGRELDHFRSHAIDLSNLVSGKPIRYYRDCNGVDVDGLPTGQLLVANCTAPRITNLDISGTDVAVGMYFVERANVTWSRLVGNDIAGAYLIRSGNSTLVGNNISGNNGGGAFLETSWNVVLARNNLSWNRGTGIGIHESSATSAVDNSVTGSITGIDVYVSTGTRVVGNVVASGGTGINLYDSPKGTVVLNEVRDNDHGIAAGPSPGTRAVHNSFVNNIDQAWEWVGALGGVAWNDTYPRGGNYWSNYTGADLFSGPNQDVPGADGIGDRPFWFPNDSRDYYPLMGPYVPTNEPPFAAFAVSPPTGDTLTRYAMDAWTSWDVEDPSPILQVRWDFQDDGLWDTPWSTAKEVQHPYPTTGLYRVRLEVLDTGGLTNQTTAWVDVQPVKPPALGGLAVSRPTPDDIRLDWRDVPGATGYRVYTSPDRFASFPSGWAILGTVSSPPFVAVGAATDGLTHFYLVRALNGTEEGPNSTMGAKTELSFAFNPAKTNIAWLSLPYNSTYRRASDIANDLGAGLVDVVGKWNPAAQTSDVYYSARGGWRGTDFLIAPGDRLYLGIRASFTWVLYGTDREVALSFNLNPSPRGNVDRVGLPFTGVYGRASSIAAVLMATNVTEIGQWDPTAQAPRRWYWTGSAWTGTDFLIDPGKDFYLVLASGFTWTPTLVTPSRP